MTRASCAHIVMGVLISSCNDIRRAILATTPHPPCLWCFLPSRISSLFPIALPGRYQICCHAHRCLIGSWLIAGVTYQIVDVVAVRNRSAPDLAWIQGTVRGYQGDVEELIRDTMDAYPRCSSTQGWTSMVRQRSQVVSISRLQSEAKWEVGTPVWFDWTSSELLRFLVGDV